MSDGPARTVRTAGDAALLVEAGAGPPAPARLAAVIKTVLSAEFAGAVSDIIPGARTVLVVTEPGHCDILALARRLHELVQAGPSADAGSSPAAGAAESPARNRPGLGAPTEGGPAEGGPDKSGPTEGRPAEGSPGESRPTEGSPAEGGPAEGGPGEGTMAKDSPGESRPTEGGLAEGGPGEGSRAEPAEDGPADDGGVAEIPVLYDGPDLAEVAELAGLTVEEVIARHSGAEYVVGWLGFSPGFAYLTGLDPALHVPRLASPRTTVPAGSVAIAGPLAAVYPSPSPGGWRLLGRTSVPLWDPGREPPAALTPGRRVRFRPLHDVPSRDRGGFSADTAENPPRVPDTGPGGGPVGRVMEVVRPGPLATVQDLGRPGYGHLGVPRSGAADPGSLRLANRLVGNPEQAAAIELTLGGATLAFHAGAWAAVTGAPAQVHVKPGRDEAGMGVPFAVPAGARLTVSAPATGLRSYLAVRGGIDVPPVLGSRSTDALSGLGPAPLSPGDVLPIGDTSGCGPIVADVAPLPAAGTGPALLRAVAGPRDDWFTVGALDVLCTAEYTVRAASDRSGLRLSGPALPRGRDGELASEGMATGALQVPPDGRPILFLADHPVTGGYPVIAVVAAADIGRAAQLRPGDTLRFRLLPSPVPWTGAGN